jgi:hypothetical protein
MRLLGVALGLNALKDLLWSVVSYTAYDFPHRFLWPYLAVPRVPFDALGVRISAGFQTLAIAGSLALIAGVLPRVGAALLLGCYGYSFVADRLAYTNNLHVFLVLLSCYLLGAGRDPRATAAAGRAAQLFIASIYLTGALTKVSALWCSGAILREALFTYQDIYTRWINLDLPVTFRLLSLGTIGVELLLGLGLWHRRARPWAIAVGVALHAGIEFFLPVRMFSYLMVASYLLFLDRRTARRIASVIERVGPLPRALVGLGAVWLLNLFFARFTGNYEPTEQARDPLLAGLAALAALSALGLKKPCPARSRVFPALRGALPLALALQLGLLVKPALGAGTDFSFRLFTEIVKLRVELWVQQRGAWQQVYLYGASHRWNSEHALYTWGNWADERIFLDAYASWVAAAYRHKAERVRVVAYLERNLAPPEEHRWERPTGP